MVSANAHSYVYLLLASRTSLTRSTSITSHTSLFFKGIVFQTGNLLFGLDYWLEYVGIIVRVLALQHANQALKSHTGIDNIHAQLLERTVGLAVELHEHKVPNLDNLWIVLVYKLTTALTAGSLLLRGTRVNVNLRARTARTCIAHLPEVIMLVSVDDMILGNVLSPIFGCLVVAWNILLGRTLEHCYIEILRIQLEHINQILPSHIDSTLLEVVAETPVAQHLEHGVVVGVVTNLLQVVMLSANTQALLCIRSTTWLGVTCAENNIFPLVHTCVRKHQRWVILNNHRS